MRPLALLAGIASAAACATAEAPRMSGFGVNEATAVVAAPESLDACTVRTGRLVLELERVMIAEYPHHHADSSHAQQPLVVRYVGLPGHLERAFWVAAARYRPGDVVGELRALRILDRPLRALGGARLIVRVAENDSSAKPRWAERAETAGGATSALGAVGLPSPASAVSDGIELLRKADRDDLILEWNVAPEEIARALASASAAPSAPARVALRYHLASTRRASPSGAPAATVDLVAYREPDPGCP